MSKKKKIKCFLTSLYCTKYNEIYVSHLDVQKVVTVLIFHNKVSQKVMNTLWDVARNKWKSIFNGDKHFLKTWLYNSLVLFVGYSL